MEAISCSVLLKCGQKRAGLTVPSDEKFLARPSAGNKQQTLFALQILLMRLLVVLDRGDGVCGGHQLGTDTGYAHAAKLQALHPVHGSDAHSVVVIGGLRKVDV